jgi:hypothetical protein
VGEIVLGSLLGPRTKNKSSCAAARSRSRAASAGTHGIDPIAAKARLARAPWPERDAFQMACRIRYARRVPFIAPDSPAGHVCNRLGLPSQTATGRAASGTCAVVLLCGSCCLCLNLNIKLYPFPVPLPLASPIPETVKRLRLRIRRPHIYD